LISEVHLVPHGRAIHLAQSDADISVGPGRFSTKNA